MTTTDWPTTHSGEPGRRFDGARGIHGRVHIPGPTHLIAATDGSWKAGCGGSGYITWNGHWAVTARVMKGYLNPIANPGVGSLVLELRAAGMVLEDFPGRAVKFLMDCKPAISYLESWRTGDVDRMPAGYSLRPRSQKDSRPALVRIAELVAGRTDLRFVHVRAHAGHVLNEGADGLAGIGRRALGGGLGDEFEVAQYASGIVTASLLELRGGAA